MKNYSIEHKNGICIVRTKAYPNKEDVIEALTEITADEQPTLRLWDISQGFDLPTDELINISEYAKLVTKVPVKLAFVAPADLAYGLTGIYKAFRHAENIKTSTFRSEADAIEWLLSQEN